MSSFDVRYTEYEEKLLWIAESTLSTRPSLISYRCSHCPNTPFGVR